MTPARVLLVLVSVMGLMGIAAPALGALHLQPPALVSRGVGPTVVLLSGLLGGTARLEPLAERLVASGFRVVSVDPYRLAADAPDVSFDGMSRTVAKALEREGVRSAIVVAHAHAAGVALRLAGNSPSLVADLVLLDAGAVARTRSAGIERAMRVASLIARLPGGHGFIRSRLASGIRANSGDPRWVTDAVAREYADPVIEELAAVARMTARLAAAEEPESVEQLLAKLRVEPTVLLGAAPHVTGASEDELTLLQRIPGARIRRVDGAGHFVHEEAPQVVVAAVMAAHTRRMTALR